MNMYCSLEKQMIGCVASLVSEMILALSCVLKIVELYTNFQYSIVEGELTLFWFPMG